MGGPADLVFTSGAVYTVDAARRWAQAVAVRNGSIVAVGADDEVAALVGPRTEAIDLRGRMLLPGFQDAHVHPVDGGVDQLRVNLVDEASLEDYRRAIRSYADTHPDEAWVLGGGWRLDVFADGEPTRQELDALVPDRPCFMPDSNGHSAWANSRALEAAGITAATPDPPDGRIVRDAAGEPGGTLLEGAMELVRRAVPPVDAALQLRGLEQAQAHLHSLGITAWQDAIVGPFSSVEDNFETYLELAGEGRLTARVLGCLWFDREGGLDQLPTLEARRARANVGRFRATAVKVMVDGGCENHTAAMTEPYLGPDGRPTDNRGIAFFDEDEMRDIVAGLDAAGFQIHVHVLGDRACRSAVDAFEALRTAGARSDLRHELAHLHVVDPVDIPRIGRAGLIANLQPLWPTHGPPMDRFTIPFLGEPRASWQYPFRSLVNEGVPLAFGSDWPVSSADPIWGIHVAVNRRLPRAHPPTRGSSEDPPFLPHERIDLPTAVAAYTIGSAYANHLDDVTGSVEVGKLADLVVLDRNVFATGLDEIGDARVVLTLVEGERVFEGDL